MASVSPKAARRGERRRAATGAVEIIRLHPSIRRRLGPVDMRRVRVLRVDNGLAVDVIVRNMAQSARH